MGTAETENSPIRSIVMQTEGGTYAVPVQINGTITLNFLLDSGASDVSIPFDVFSTLIRSGTINKSDLLDLATYRLADGSTSKNIRFPIRSLKVGDILVKNIVGSVGPEKGSLLLGESFLRKFKSWSIITRTTVCYFKNEFSKTVFNPCCEAKHVLPRAP